MDIGVTETLDVSADRNKPEPIRKGAVVATIPKSYGVDACVEAQQSLASGVDRAALPPNDQPVSGGQAQLHCGFCVHAHPSYPPSLRPVRDPLSAASHRSSAHPARHTRGKLPRGRLARMMAPPHAWNVVLQTERKAQSAKGKAGDDETRPRPARVVGILAEVLRA